MLNQPYLDEKQRSFDPDFILLRQFLPRPLAGPASALFALRAELRSIAVEVTEADVALAKLGWWQQEWDRLGQRKPRHPVTQALPPGAGEVSITPALSAIAVQLEQPMFADQSMLRNWLRQLALPFAELESQLPMSAAREQLIDGWVATQQLALLEDWLRLTERQRAPLPLALQARLQLTAGQLAQDSAGQRQLVAALLPELVGNGLTAAYLQVKAVDRPLLQRRAERFLNGQRVNPVRRILAAWRAGRRINRTWLDRPKA